MHGMTVFSDEPDAFYPGYLKNEEEKLAREQRRLSHCRKGSCNYRKQKRKIVLCHEKVRKEGLTTVFSIPSSRKDCREKRV